MKTPSLAQTILFVALISISFVPTIAEETADDWERMVFHLDEAANARWALMLSNAYLDDSPKAKLVIVAHGPGIDFLLEGAEDRRLTSLHHQLSLHGEPSLLHRHARSLTYLPFSEK